MYLKNTQSCIKNIFNMSYYANGFGFLIDDAS